MKGKSKNVINSTLTGVVAPVEWDNGQVTAVALCATDDEDYRIENSDKFYHLVRHSIEATGIIRQYRKSFKSIRIKRYHVLDAS